MLAVSGGERASGRCAGIACIRRRAAAGALAGLALILSGCYSLPDPSAEQLDRGLVWVFPGVDSDAARMRPVIDAYRSAGVDSAIRMHDWTRPFGLFSNLVSLHRNRADADRIAREIAAYGRAHPGRPIDLVGYSGGAGMAVFTAEALPADVHLRHVILVQAALSPQYDLCPALERVDGRLVAFHCPRDWLILGAGTSLLGTMDRRHSAAAGKDGFEIEQAIRDAALRERFEPQCWTSEAIREGHPGSHRAMLAYDWNRLRVAPRLIAATAGMDVARVSGR